MMTLSRVRVEHVGGPYDGEHIPVKPMSDGSLPLFYTLGGLTPLNWMISPGSGPMASATQQFYELDSVTDADGVARPVYRFRGQDLADAA